MLTFFVSKNLSKKKKKSINQAQKNILYTVLQFTHYKLGSVVCDDMLIIF